MLKLTVAVLAIALAGTASAAGWRSLRVDGSSEAAFEESVAAFQQKLPRVRRAVFERSLNDIWAEGTKAAQAGGREYTMTDYLRQLDSLSYKQVVEFMDPTGDTADRYFRVVYANLFPRTVPSSPAIRQSYYPGTTDTVLDGPQNTPLGVNPWQR